MKRSVSQLREQGAVDYAFLGVSTADVYPQLGARFHLGADRGAWVQGVTKGGPADERGDQGRRRLAGALPGPAPTSPAAT